MDYAERSLNLQSHQTPRYQDHKGDGIRIPTTKGDESAKPESERNIDLSLGLAMTAKPFSPPRMINPKLMIKYIISIFLFASFSFV